jgi:hypothetical protein
MNIVSIAKYVALMDAMSIVLYNTPASRLIVLVYSRDIHI